LFYRKHNKSMPRYFSIITVVLTLAFVSVFFGQIDGMASDPGLGWHLKTGALIASNLEIPRVDPFLAPALEANPFSAPTSGREWVCDQWLGDLILHQLFVFGGWPLLYSSVVGVFLLAFWGVTSDGLLRSGVTTLSVMIAGIMAWKAGQVHMIIRPVVFSVLFFAIVLRVVCSLEGMREWSTGGRWRPVLALSCLFIVWANIHPAFVLGLGVLGVYFVAECFRSPRNFPAIKTSALIVVMSALGTVVNPQGLMLHRSIFALGLSDYFMSLNQEWHPLKLSSFEGILLIGLVVFALIGFVRAMWMRSASNGFGFLVSGLLFLLTVRSVRYAPFAALALLPVAATGLHTLRDLSLPRCLSLTARVIKVVQRWEVLRSPTALGVSGLLVASSALISVVAPHMLFARALGPANASSLVPVMQVLESVRGRGGQGEGVVLTSPNLGGAITYRLWPRYRAVIDDRNTLIGEALYKGYFASLEDIAAFDLIVEVFGVTDAIMPPHAGVLNQLLLRPQWTILYRDEQSVVVHRE
jgi:hypothetical protein